MKKISLVLLAVGVFLLSFRTAAPSSWTLDPAHSQLEFSVTMMMLSDIDGTFRIREGKLTTPNNDFSDATVYMKADTKSIDTDSDERDAHLRTADFFDAEKFPTIIFKSNSFKKIGDTRYTVTGELTMHGVTKPVTLEAIGKTNTHPVTGKTIAGFKVRGMIKRSDFGISPATPTAMLNDEVAITANVQFAKE